MNATFKLATIALSGFLFAGMAAADIVRWDSTNNPQLPWQSGGGTNQAYFRFDSGAVAPPLFDSNGNSVPITTGPGLVGVDVPPGGGPDSQTCSYRNSGGIGLSTFGARIADQGVAPVSFGQTIDGSLPYASAVISNANSQGYFAVKFFLSPTATTPNFGWMQGPYCDIFTTSVNVVSFGYNTIPGQPITAGAAAQISSPSLLLAGLIAMVKEMNLKQGISNSLDAKLQGVQDALAATQNGDQPGACNKMNAFIYEVNAQTGKSITQAQADQLLAVAAGIRTALGCTL